MTDDLYLSWHLATPYQLSSYPLSLFIEDDNGKLMLLADEVLVPHEQLEGILPDIQQGEVSSVYSKEESDAIKWQIYAWGLFMRIM